MYKINFNFEKVLETMDLKKRMHLAATFLHKIALEDYNKNCKKCSS